MLKTKGAIWFEPFEPIISNWLIWLKVSQKPYLHQIDFSSPGYCWYYFFEQSHGSKRCHGATVPSPATSCDVLPGILIFLPGWDDIDRLLKRLTKARPAALTLCRPAWIGSWIVLDHFRSPMIWLLSHPFPSFRNALNIRLPVCSCCVQQWMFDVGWLDLTM